MVVILYYNGIIYITVYSYSIRMYLYSSEFQQMSLFNLHRSLVLYITVVFINMK